MILKKTLEPYCKALERGIEDKNWHLALMAACTLPDICISLEGKREGKYFNNDDYINWFDTYVKEYQYTGHRRKGMEKADTLEKHMELIKEPLRPDNLEPFQIIFFTGVNAYALRCAFLHQADGEIARQKVYEKNSKYTNALKGVEKVKFDTDLDLIFEQRDNIGFLNPKIYCNAILDGVTDWIKVNEKNNDSKLLNRATNILVFE